ncbi:DUF5050 domain-containing protein [candidate division KSB1 bacterium]
MKRLCTTVCLITALSLLSCVSNPFGSGAETLIPIEPSSMRLAYSGIDENGTEIYATDAFGVVRQRLTDDLNENIMPAWSPDGTKIAYAADNTICVMNTDGSDKRDLVEMKLDEKIKWSTDGQWVSFFTDVDPSYLTSLNLILVRSDGSDVRIPVQGLSFHDTFDWSPVGNEIVFSRYINSSFDINIITVDGSERTIIQGVSSPDFSLSPDGNTILFDQGKNLYTIDVIDSTVNQLTFDETRKMNPSWSPDGSRILYYTYQSGIYTMNADGTNNRLISGQTIISELSWSPDGLSVSYLAWQWNNEELFVINADGSDERRLLPGMHVRSYSWCPVTVNH